MIRYQDRLLYGTDSQFGEEEKPLTKSVEMEKIWREDWRFLVSADWMENTKVNGKFQGLRLPRQVIDKIYHGNFLKFFPQSFTESNRKCVK
jgi:hypothetical protein